MRREKRGDQRRRGSGKGCFHGLKDRQIRENSLLANSHTFSSPLSSQTALERESHQWPDFAGTDTQSPLLFSCSENQIKINIPHTLKYPGQTGRHM